LIDRAYVTGHSARAYNLDRGKRLVRFLSDSLQEA
jgi:hypothetical protein